MEPLLIGLLLGLALLASTGVIWFVLDQRVQRKLHALEKSLRAQADADLQQRWQNQSASLNAEQVALRVERERLQDAQQSLFQGQEQLRTAQSELQAAQHALAQRQQEQTYAAQQQLEKLAGLSAEAARAQLLEHWEHQLQTQMAQTLQQHEARLREQQQELADEILTRAVQRTAGRHAAERMSLKVALPHPRLKGRLIGREGRNIQALQAATGADLVVDSERAVVEISSFDPVRRELAKRTIEALLADGRITPELIAAEAERQQNGLESELDRLGEAAALEAGVPGLDNRLLKALGRLHYRSSYGQNVLTHSIEVAKLAGSLAEQLHANPEVARRGALLHDLGKGLTESDSRLSHTESGVELARQAGESEAVLHAIAAHHFEVPPASAEAVIVQTADTLSAARPGARHHDLSRQVQRLESLERLAHSFRGVKRAYVLRAGKELQVLVDPDEVPETAVGKLAFDLARRIEQELSPPVPVRVTVLREIQASDVAR